MKVLIIQNIPNPYRIPLFNLLNAQLEKEGHELKVIFGHAGYSGRLFKLDLKEIRFNCKILRSQKILPGMNGPVFNYNGIYRELKEYNPDKIIVIGYSIATLKVYLYSHFHKVSYFIWGGTSMESPYAKSKIRKFLRILLLKRASGAIAYGTRAKDYFNKLGVPINRIWIAINSTDTSYFFEKTKELRSIKSLSTKKHLTCISYFRKSKSIDKILEIINLLKEERNDFILDLVGDGPEMSNLKNYTDKNNLNDFIVFHGFKQKHELPEILSESDCFLFQTDYDTFGLVLTEAMSAGVTCLSSVNAGATYDLIKNGETGFVVDFDDAQDVINKIEYLFDNQDENSRIAKQGQQFVLNNATLKNSVEGFLQALEVIKS